MNQYKKIINEMISLSFLAGEEIMELYNNKLKQEIKDDQSPVTEADLISDNLICKGLEKKFPKIMCISEESYKKKDIFNVNSTFFLIDPLDGTKEFIKRNDEFTVNIALIIDKKAKFGVIYAPAKKVMFYTNEEGKSFQLNIGSKEKKFKIENSIEINVSRKKEKIVSIMSRSHNNKNTDEYLKKYTVEKKIICGSSLKFCLVANGTASIYPRLGPTREWDTAAGHAILNGAGGTVKKLNGDEFIYGKLDRDFLNPEFIATNF